MTDSIFNTPPADGNTPPDDQNKNYLEELVGEGKKFKTEQDLAKGKVEADRFIAQLTAEAEELRKELNTRLTLEQYLDQISTNKQPNDNGQDSRLNEPNGHTDNDDKPSLKAADIEALIERKVSERERQRIQSQNIAEVKQKLTEAFGNNLVPKLKEVSSALGMTEEEFNEMAATRPKAFLKLVGVDGTPPQNSNPAPGLFTPPTSQVNSASQQQRVVTGDKTKAYYDSIKQKDPKTYWTPAVQNQMHKDAIRLGERFFDS